MQAAPTPSHASAVNGEHPRGGGTNPASQSCRILAVKKQTCNQSWAKSQPIWRIPVLLRPRGCDRAAVAWGLTWQCCRLRLMVAECMYFKGHQIKSVWPPEGKNRFLFICVQEKKRALVTRTSAGKINNGDTVAQNVHDSCWVLLNGLCLLAPLILSLRLCSLLGIWHCPKYNMKSGICCWRIPLCTFLFCAGLHIQSLIWIPLESFYFCC